jgi:hypothetical protein
MRRGKALFMWRVTLGRTTQAQRRRARGARRLQPRRPAAVRCSAWLDRLDVAAIAFELHLRNAVKRHPHLREPRGHGVFAGSFQHADGLAFGQVGKAAIAFDSWILLRRLRELSNLIRREFTRRNGVGGHEFCHNVFLSVLLFVISHSSLMDEISQKADCVSGIGIGDSADQGVLEAFLPQACANLSRIIPAKSFRLASDDSTTLRKSSQLMATNSTSVLARIEAFRRASVRRPISPK